MCDRRLVRRRTAAIAGALAFAAGMPVAGHSQVDIGSRLSNPVKFSGEIGSLGELYTISGRERRRPSSTGRLYMRSRLLLFNTVTVNLDLLYSTESGSGVSLGSTGRQSLNQIGIAPEWSWGRAYLGSFHDSYSSLTFDGVALRGAGLNINPGPVRVAAFAGRAQNAVSGGAVDGAYQRTMSGGRIGFGRRPQRGQGGYLDIVFVRTADDPASLPAPTGSAAVEPDAGDHTVNAYAVTPEENVVVAAVTRVPLGNERFILSGEVAASLYSRDRRAPLLSDEALDEYSGLLRSFIAPRASTYGDIAHNGQIEVRNIALPGATRESPRSLTAAVGYRYVGAGYVSLGTASLPADQRALSARASVRFRAWTASVQGMQQHDNLLGQKLATTTRNRLSVSTSIRPTRALSSSLRFAITTMSNDTNDPERRADFTSLTIGATQNINLVRQRVLRAVSVSYGYQQAGDSNPLRSAGAFSAHDASVRATLEASRYVSFVPGAGLAYSNAGAAGWKLRQTYSFAAQYRAGRRFSSSASLSNSRLHAGGSIQAALSSRYRITDGDQLTLAVRTNRVSGLETVTGSFHEHTMTLQWSRTIQ